MKTLLLPLFSLESTPTQLDCSACSYVKQEASKKWSVQEEGLTNEGRHHLLLLHKQAHHIVGSLPAYINRAGLTACEVGTSQLLKDAHPPL